jgi:hypothetical protein
MCPCSRCAVRSKLRQFLYGPLACRDGDSPREIKCMGPETCWDATLWTWLMQLEYLGSGYIRYCHLCLSFPFLFLFLSVKRKVNFSTGCTLDNYVYCFFAGIVRLHFMWLLISSGTYCFSFLHFSKQEMTSLSNTELINCIFLCYL